MDPICGVVGSEADYRGYVAKKAERREEMREKRAKRIRAQIYGDFSQRERRYGRERSGAIVCLGRRKQYKVAKKTATGGGGHQ